MTETTNAAVSKRRWMRLAGLAGMLWIVFELVAPWLMSEAYTAAWARQMAINAGPVLVLSVAALRGNFLGTVLLGVYGAYRLTTATLVVRRLSGDTPPLPHDWIVWIAIPLAILWIIGGIAALRLRSLTRQSSVG